MGQDLLRVKMVSGTDRVTLALRGELDLSSAGLVVEKFAEAVQQSPAAIDVDLSRLDYSDSVGLSVFVTAHFQCFDAGIELRFVEPNLFIQELFAITGLNEVLSIVYKDALVGG